MKRAVLFFSGAAIALWLFAFLSAFPYLRVGEMGFWRPPRLILFLPVFAAGALLSSLGCLLKHRKLLTGRRRFLFPTIGVATVVLVLATVPVEAYERAMGVFHGADGAELSAVGSLRWIHQEALAHKGKTGGYAERLSDYEELSPYLRAGESSGYYFRYQTMDSNGDGAC